jgi:RNA polymerase sigma-70 factor (ECF subfamily)
MQTDEEAPPSIYDTNIDMDTPYTKMVQNQRTQMVHKALNSLPEEQKIVVMLKELEGLKFREIAELLQLPENTVKSRLYYGLTALRKYFSHFNLEQEVKSA